MSTAPVTMEESYGLFRHRRDGDLGHRARTVAEQSWVEHRELFDYTVDKMATVWPRVWTTPVPDWRRPPAFQPEYNYATTVMARRFVRLSKKSSARLADEAPEEQVLATQRSTAGRACEDNPELTLLRKEQANQIYALVRRLPGVQRNVFVMRASLGMSVAEVADALHISTRQVTLAYARATRKLRELAVKEGLL